ncbi:SDR family oxidoreductase [Edaphobacter flagellatus]|uniref:SDR family oxidoreductase n=1 Tax=Edaphobacter flagellatus TaxID=1933044 RepID=UPI0021B49292|nr:SDR family oxidoreductase [Edaphobacter flagellatus]
MSTVLITGIAGFIGSSIARALVAEGAQVRGIDNLSSGSMANLEEIRSQIDFRDADVLDTAAVASAMKGVDYVFHEAAIPSVPKSVNDPVGTNGPNLTGTLNVLEAARQAGVKRLLYAASSAAYGDDPALPKTEAMLPSPISPYAVQKVAGEHYLASYYRVYGLETVSLRYFNIFGPRQDPSSQYSGVLARFISLMLAGQTPTIYGDGLTSRDFTYIDNVVSANLLAARAPRENVAGRIFNIATGRRVTLLDAFAEIKRITGFKGDVRHEAERQGDIKHSGADISLAQKAFGYQVVADLAYGLEQTIAWARESVPVA